MSEIALNEARNVDRDQAHRNDARRILQRVVLALDTQQSSGVRWPFELVQNAHDFGARDGEDLVEIEFVQQDDDLVVSHNGRIFSIPELKALLSGGSSKEFDGEDTTGRFGTGFLVTHAISTRVDVDGILQTAEGKPEIFHIKLNRPADEAEILKNIEHTDEAFVAAQPVSEVSDRPTASFTYHNANIRVVELGLDRLEQTIPYLYATCDKLGKIRVQRPHKTTVFQRMMSPEKEPEKIGGFPVKRAIVSVSEGATTRQFTAFSIFTKVEIDVDGKGEGKDVSSGLLVVLEHNDGKENSVILPEPEFPKVFVQFPINETGFLPFNVVLDSRFNPKQERDGIAMNDDDKKLIEGALSALPAVIGYAVDLGWQNSHELAHLAVPKQALAGENAAIDELVWWKGVIMEVAEATASKPIIATESGFLPALSEDDAIVSFLVPATDATEQNLIDYNEIHNLACRVTNIDLPNKAVAQDWGQIARQWSDIGLPVHQLGLTELADWVKDGCKAITDLPISITTSVQGGMWGDARMAARRLAWERLARSLLSCVSSSHRSNSVGPNRSRGSISRTTR